MIKISEFEYILGVSDISVSTVDDTIFIANKRVITSGLEGSIAAYNTNGNVEPISVEKIVWDKTTDTLSIKNCKTNSLHLTSSHNDFKIAVCTTPNAGDKLMILDNNKPIIAIDSNRSTFFSRLQFKKFEKQMITPKGCLHDSKGDFTVIENYLYYCTKDFDGISNIWIRWKASETEW